jgi:hypothetical protein
MAVAITDKRAAWTRELFELAKTDPKAAVQRIRDEARSLGRSHGWVGACEWFEDNDKLIAADDAHGPQWLAYQSLVWFAREV